MKSELNIQSDRDFFNSSELFFYIIKYRKHLTIIACISFVVSAIASFIMESRYKSTVIMIPTTSISISHTIFKEWDDVLKFGEEKEAEQMIQLLNSEEIMDRIANKYNLLKHYNIKENDIYKKLHLKSEYDERVSFSKTPSNAVEITVLDRSPDTAAYIANDIAALVDSTKNKLQKKRALLALNIVEQEYLAKMKFVKKLQDSLKEYTHQCIFDYEMQSGIIYKQYAMAVASGNSSGAKELDNKLKNIGSQGYEYVALRDYENYERTQVYALKTKYDQAKVDVDRTLPSKYLVNPGMPAEKKTTPIRWLIIAGSTIASVILAFISLLAFDRFKYVNSTSSNKSH